MATAYSVGLVIAYLEKVSHQELGSYWFYSALPILFLLVGSTCIAHAFPKAKDSEAESKKLKSGLPTTPNS